MIQGAVFSVLFDDIVVQLLISCSVNMLTYQNMFVILTKGYSVQYDFTSEDT